MMTIANELIKAITGQSKTSARSLQTEVGPSEIGGCRRKVYMKINGWQPVNHDTLKLASIMGTAIHTYIQESFKKQDPFGERYLLEESMEAEGIKGHIDMFDIENGEVIDWKTTKKSNLTYFPSRQQRWQVQVYGWLLEQNNYEVKNVTLVAIPRDGDERDIVYHTEPYDKAVAKEAIKWLEEVVQYSNGLPPAEKDVSFCKLYCQYYDPTGMKGCSSRPKAVAEGAVIDDPDLSSAAKDYLHIVSEINNLEKFKDGLKAKLEGTSGVTPDGIKVSWSTVAGRKMVDEDKVKELLGEVPVRYGKETVRLSVKGE